MSIAHLHKDGTVEWIPAKVLERFMSTVNHYLTLHCANPKNGDVGYSYVTQVKDKKKVSYKLGAANKSPIRFLGDLSCSPKAGSLLVTSMWGIKFYMEPQNKVQDSK